MQDNSMSPWEYFTSSTDWYLTTQQNNQLTLGTMQAARTLMQDSPLNDINPRVLVVPPELENQAQFLLRGVTGFEINVIDEIDYAGIPQFSTNHTTPKKDITNFKSYLEHKGVL